MNRFTLIGMAAVLLWSMMTALVRLTSDSFGATLGVALIYTCAAVLLWLTYRPKDLRHTPKKYLFVGGTLFIVYEACVSLSIGFATSPQQAIEVSIVNYLWPSLMVLLIALRNGTTRLPLLALGLTAALIGTALALGGDAGLDIAAIAANIVSNPLPYALALTGAIGWTVYSVFTPSMSDGHDCVTLFFTLVAVTLWILFFIFPSHDAPLSMPEPAAFIPLLGAAVVIGAGYACWNVGILKGDMTILSCASYAAPILSSAAASLLLFAPLSFSFWVGVVLVVAGSVLSWLSMGKARSAE